MNLTISNCTKKFRNKRALDNFSVEFQEGTYGILGPNGAGKTTLLRCICGLCNFDSGIIQGVGEQVGYLPQSFGVFRELTVLQMLQYLATLKRIPKNNQKQEIERCLQQVNLLDHLSNRISSLSGGMIRRLGIAQAILGDPTILLFDEPTVGLDLEERTRFKNVISSRRHKGTVLISTHIVSDVETLCDRIVVMDKGKLLTSASTYEIACIASGKVYLVPETLENQLQGRFFLKDRIEMDGISMLRVLSSETQPGKVIPPTIEDGYLCLIKEF